MAEKHAKDPTPEAIFGDPGNRQDDPRDGYLGYFDDFPNPIWRAGTDAKCNYFNREWLAFTGRTLAQETGDGWAEGVHPEDFDRCLKTYLDAFGRREPFEMEYRLRHHDGTYHWLLDCGKPFYNARGGFAGYLGSCYDINDRKTAETALLESEKRYRDMFEINNAVMIIVDPESRQIVDANAAACRYYGYSREEMKKLLINQINTKDLEAIKEDMAHAAASPGAVFQFRHKKKNGEIRDVHVFSGSVHFGGRMLLHSIIQDVTEEVRSGAALKESEKRYRDLVENLSEVIVSVDREGKFTYISPVVERLYGYLPADLTGKNFLPFIHPDDRDRVTEGFGRELSGLYPSDEFRILAHDGSVRWISATPQPIERDGRISGFNYVMADITERKNAEEALRESEQKFREIFNNVNDGIELNVMKPDGSPGKFVEVNNVACGILGYTREELLQMSPADIAAEEPGPRVGEVCKELSTRGHARFETGHRNRQGVIVPVEINAQLVTFGGKDMVLAVVRDVTARKKAEAEERLTRDRLETLVKIAGMRDAGEREVSECILEAACRMTASTIAFLGVLAPDESAMETGYWISSGTKGAHAFSLPAHLRLDRAGIWAEAVRAHRPRIVNDFSADSRSREGLVHGHMPLSRFLSLPVMDNGRVAMVVVVANKEAPYDETDVTRLSLLMQGVWGHLERRRSDKALRESEEKFRLFFNNVNDEVYVHEIDSEGQPGRLVEVNDVMCQRLGYTREELLARSIPDILTDEGKRRILEAKLEVSKTGHTVFETEHLRKDGSILLVEVSTHQFTRGEARLALANARDITGRRKAEEALRKSEALLNEMGELARIGGWELDLQSKAVVMTAESYRISEIPESEVLDMALAVGYFDLPGRALLLSALQRCAESGEPFDLELPFTTKTGRHIWTRSLGHAVRQEGRIVRITGTLQDVTEMKKAGIALLESRQLLEAVLNAITFRVFWKDKNLVFLGCNTAFARDAGYERPEDVVGKDDYSMSWREQAAGYIADDRKVIETGMEKLLFEEAQTSPSGEIRYLLTSKVPLRDAGGTVIGVLGSYLDITERKKAEAVLRDFNRELEAQVNAQTGKINAALNEKVLLLREIHHRVKNNLQLIISLTNLQMRQSNNEQLIQVMKETQNRVRAMSLVHEKLYQSEDIARISLAEYTRFLATQLFAFYGSGARRVKLEIDIGKIMLDINTAIPMGLIINELVSNALKHAFPDNREGEILIRAREEGNEITLLVQDTGTGMPKDLDIQESPTLGLRLVRILSEQLNGTVELLPKEKGTAFFIRLKKAKSS